MEIECVKQDEPNANAIDWAHAVKVEVEAAESDDFGQAGQDACQKLYDETLTDAQRAGQVHFWWRPTNRHESIALWSKYPEIKEMPTPAE